MKTVEISEFEGQEERLVNHLLFHKSLIDEDRDGSRIDDYLALLEEEGTHLSIQDPFEKSIAIAFELAIDHHLDPWDVDLLNFSSLYLQRAKEEELDLVTAGRIILLAWQVLKLQSKEVVDEAETDDEPEDEVLEWDAIPDWTFEPAEEDFTRQVLDEDDPPLDEPIRRENERRVSLFELVEAFDEARDQAERRQRLERERERARKALEERRKQSDDDRMHTDDLEQEIEETWDRIRRFNGHPIPLPKLHEPTRYDRLKTLMSVLFLAKDKKIRVDQDDFPRGSIYVENRDDGGTT